MEYPLLARSSKEDPRTPGLLTSPGHRGVFPSRRRIAFFAALCGLLRSFYRASPALFHNRRNGFVSLCLFFCFLSLRNPLSVLRAPYPFFLLAQRPRTSAHTTRWAGGTLFPLQMPTWMETAVSPGDVARLGRSELALRACFSGSGGIRGAKGF